MQHETEILLTHLIYMQQAETTKRTAHELMEEIRAVIREIEGNITPEIEMQLTEFLPTQIESMKKVERIVDRLYESEGEERKQ